MLKVDGPPPVPAGVDQVVALDLDVGGEPAHGPRQADQLGDGLALGAQRDEEGSGLDVADARPP